MSKTKRLDRDVEAEKELKKTVKAIPQSKQSLFQMSKMKHSAISIQILDQRERIEESAILIDFFNSNEIKEETLKWFLGITYFIQTDKGQSVIIQNFYEKVNGLLHRPQSAKPGHQYLAASGEDGNIESRATLVRYGKGKTPNFGLLK